MKKSGIVLVTFTVILFSLFTQCTKDAPEPVADFTFTGDNSSTSSEVTFINTSQNATTYLWTFGDGGTSTEKSPKHTYTTGNTYTVTLEATGDGGSKSISKSLTIKSVSVIFWCASATLGGSYIDIWVNSNYEGRITTYSYYGYAPNCGDSGYVTVTKSPGTHSWNAKGQDGSTWSNRTMTLTATYSCWTLKLTGKKKSPEISVPFDQAACD